MNNELFWVEYYADDLKSRSDSIAHYSRLLVSRPPFETKAEAALDRAEGALLRALQLVRQAKMKLEQVKEAA
jgi:hypothetical protein